MQKQIAERSEETKEYLNELSLSVKGRFLEEWMYELASKSIETSLRLSTRHAYHENEYYRNMPPYLQSKLVKSTLYQTINSLEYFVNDYRTD